jgi:hypothetical protein
MSLAERAVLEGEARSVRSLLGVLVNGVEDTVQQDCALSFGVLFVGHTLDIVKSGVQTTLKYK